MGQVFEHIVFDKQTFSDIKGNEYYHCQFQNCNFSEASSNEVEFHDCSFQGCNLSMVNFGHSVLNNVKFFDCKVMGVDFGKCSKYSFQASFEQCVIKYAMFIKNDLKNTSFKKCTIHETNFLECKMIGIKFADCDLERSLFEQNNMEQSDFSTARNYIINPEINRVKKSTFAMPDVVGLLQHLAIEIV